MIFIRKILTKSMLIIYNIKCKMKNEKNPFWKLYLIWSDACGDYPAHNEIRP